MTDREKARALVERLNERIGDEAFSKAVRWLQTILSKNQNQPPQGHADRSFTIEQWYSLRSVVMSAYDLERYTKQFAAMESIVGQLTSMRENLKSQFEAMLNTGKN